MDPNTELVLSMMADLRAQMAAGFLGVNARLDVINGRTRRNEESVATLNERTGEMECVSHGERMAALARDAEQLKIDVEHLQDDVARCGGVALQPERPYGKWALTGGAVAGGLALLDGIWQWLHKAVGR
jgi:hypothetical protein